MVVAGHVPDSSIQFFSVTNGSCLQQARAMIDPLLPWQRLCVVGLHGKEWHLDPLVERAQDWRLWIWEGRILSDVEWDPAEWRWLPLDASKSPVPFFSYSARLGRRILGTLQHRPPTQAHRWWHAQGVSLVFLRTFWKTLWAN